MQIIYRCFGMSFCWSLGLALFRSLIQRKHQLAAKVDSYNKPKFLNSYNKWGNNINEVIIRTSNTPSPWIPCKRLIHPSRAFDDSLPLSASISEREKKHQWLSWKNFDQQQRKFDNKRSEFTGSQLYFTISLSKKQRIFLCYSSGLFVHRSLRHHLCLSSLE